MKKTYELVDTIRIHFLITILLSSVIIFWGCSGNYGNIQRSREAGRSFENFQVYDDHNYYFSGPANSPYAIIGIQKDYVLKTRLWKRVDLTPEKLKSWLNLGMQGTLGFPPAGGYILGPDREKIGIWYSIFNGTVVKMENDNIVVVHPPASYPGQNVRPAIERGAIESKDHIWGVIKEDHEIKIAYAD